MRTGTIILPPDATRAEYESLRRSVLTLAKAFEGLNAQVERMAATNAVLLDRLLQETEKVKP